MAPRLSKSRHPMRHGPRGSGARLVAPNTTRPLKKKKTEAHGPSNWYMFEVQNPGCEGQNPSYEGPMSLWEINTNPPQPSKKSHVVSFAEIVTMVLFRGKHIMGFINFHTVSILSVVLLVRTYFVDYIVGLYRSVFSMNNPAYGAEIRKPFNRRLSWCYVRSWKCKSIATNLYYIFPKRCI